MELRQLVKLNSGCHVRTAYREGVRDDGLGCFGTVDFGTGPRDSGKCGGARAVVRNLPGVGEGQGQGVSSGRVVAGAVQEPGDGGEDRNSAG